MAQVSISLGTYRNILYRLEHPAQRLALTEDREDHTEGETSFGGCPGAPPLSATENYRCLPLRLLSERPPPFLAKKENQNLRLRMKDDWLAALQSLKLATLRMSSSAMARARWLPPALSGPSDLALRFQMKDDWLAAS